MAAWRTGFPGLARKLVALGGPGVRITPRVTRAAGVALAGAGAVYTGLLLAQKSGYRSPGVLRVCAQSEEVVDEAQEKQSLRKQRFMHFASLEYEGEYYMTPRDFLFSVMFENLQLRRNNPGSEPSLRERNDQAPSLGKKRSYYKDKMEGIVIQFLVEEEQERVCVLQCITMDSPALPYVLRYMIIHSGIP